jgi:hypothetical protein
MPQDEIRAAREAAVEADKAARAQRDNDRHLAKQTEAENEAGAPSYVVAEKVAKGRLAARRGDGVPSILARLFGREKDTAQQMQELQERLDRERAEALAIIARHGELVSAVADCERAISNGSQVLDAIRAKRAESEERMKLKITNNHSAAVEVIRHGADLSAIQLSERFAADHLTELRATLRGLKKQLTTFEDEHAAALAEAPAS